MTGRKPGEGSETEDVSESMEYEEIVTAIMGRRRFGKACGRQVAEELLARLNCPERGMRVIHIAGTNGKGSTAAFVSSILQAAGFCVGQFTSPHLVDFTERIQVNGRQISREDAARLGQRLLDLPMELECTMFDLCLGMALLYFRERRCDFVVLETGLGGRLDSTSGLSQVPLVSVVTNIGLDHVQILGDTLEEIAAEKAGIFKPGTEAVFGKMDAAARRVLIKRCEELGIPWRDAGKLEARTGTGGSDTGEVTGLRLGLFGAYQRQNATTAAAVFDVIMERCPEMFGGMSEEKRRKILLEGLRRAVWPGRMEILSEDPFLLVDGAHNPQGVAALAESLRQAYPGERFLFVAGILADKDYEGMLERMIPLAEKFYTVTVESSRSLQGQAVAEYLRGKGQEAVYMEDLSACLRTVLSEGKQTGKRIVAFGSLYFIGSLEALWRAGAS